jgi:IS30 family transposase
VCFFVLFLLGYLFKETILGTYEVRNEIETKRNETKSTKTIRNETKRNEINEQYFSNTMATSLSGGGSRSTQREPPTMDKQLDNFITGGWESGTT